MLNYALIIKFGSNYHGYYILRLLMSDLTNNYFNTYFLLPMRDYSCFDLILFNVRTMGWSSSDSTVYVRYQVCVYASGKVPLNNQDC